MINTFLIFASTLFAPGSQVNSSVLTSYTFDYSSTDRFLVDIEYNLSGVETNKTDSLNNTFYGNVTLNNIAFTVNIGDPDTPDYVFRGFKVFDNPIYIIEGGLDSSSGNNYYFMMKSFNINHGYNDNFLTINFDYYYTKDSVIHHDFFQLYSDPFEAVPYVFDFSFSSPNYIDVLANDKLVKSSRLFIYQSYGYSNGYSTGEKIGYQQGYLDGSKIESPNLFGLALEGVSFALKWEIFPGFQLGYAVGFVAFVGLMRLILGFFI